MPQKNKNHNQVTINAYEKSIKKYFDQTAKTVSGEVKIWINKTLSYILYNSKILEIGTGTGRDADYIENLGYQVQRSDLPNSFIKYNQKKGKNIIKLNVLDVNLAEKYDLIYANGVLLHFTKLEVIKILKDIHNILNNEGIFAFSLKKGIGEEYIEAKINGLRFYKYRLNEEIDQVLTDAGFVILYLENAKSDKWIQIICRKKQIF